MPADVPWLAREVDDDELAAAIASYRERGYALVPGVVSEEGLALLRARADDLMFGRSDGTPFFFQHDAATGRYEDAPLGEGWVGPSLEYRKIEKLERDPHYRAYLSNRLFERIARAVLGEDGITLYRAILMTKPARRPSVAGGTQLPWHQDGGLLWGLAAPPELQLWTALDDAPVAAGCMSVAVGSHHAGLATQLGGAVPAEVVARTNVQTELVPARAGDVVLLHNLAWHASGLNETVHARRAFSVCLLAASNRCVRKRRAPREFPRIFAPGPSS